MINKGLLLIFYINKFFYKKTFRILDYVGRKIKLGLVVWVTQMPQNLLRKVKVIYSIYCFLLFYFTAFPQVYPLTWRPSLLACTGCSSEFVIHLCIISTEFKNYPQIETAFTLLKWHSQVFVWAQKMNTRWQIGISAFVSLHLHQDVHNAEHCTFDGRPSNSLQMSKSIGTQF